MISIILPTLNERDNIISLIQVIEQLLSEHELEIINIDDNSSDGTHNAVAKHAHGRTNIKTILRQDEKGFCSALQKGIDLSQGEIIIWLDCDFSHPPDLMPRMVREIIENNFDAVIPSRFIPGSKDMTAVGAPVAVKLQKKLSIALNRLCTIRINKDFHDWTSGYIAVRSDFIKSHQFKGDFCEYFMELMCHLIQQKAKILEIPFTSPKRTAGDTKSAPSLIGLFKQGRKYIKMFRFIARAKNPHE